MPVDPTMVLAFEMGRQHSTVGELPASLVDRAARARLVHEIDPPIEWTTSILLPGYDFGYTIHAEGQRIPLMARLDPAVKEVAARLLADVEDEDARVSICLRLWAGCLDGAKIIALGTRSGPNTPESRARAYDGAITPRAAIDAVYAAGAEAALAFKQLRNQETCFDGLPAHSILRVPE